MIGPPPSLAAAQQVIDERLSRFPEHPFFLCAKRDLDRVGERFRARLPVDRPFYDSLKVGLMCARELESTEMPVCDAIYAVLTDILPKTV